MEPLNRLTTGLATIGRFAAHLLEMCMAMCLGAVILNGLIWGSASLLGYTDLTQRFPEFSALLVTLTLSLPMAAWMRFRGHEWQHTLEMSGATVVVGVLLIGGFWLSVVSQSGLIEWQIRLACLWRCCCASASTARDMRHIMPCISSRRSTPWLIAGQGMTFADE